MNTRQALAKCFKYFLDPKHKAGYRNNNCVYYANGGNPTMCAIGCLLPVKYRVRAAAVLGDVEALYRKVPELEEFFKDTNSKTLGYMQGAHDSWAQGHKTREDFLNSLQNLMCYHETTTNADTS